MKSKITQKEYNKMYPKVNLVRRRPTKCENCGCKLNEEEIKHNDGWCFYCNCPENSYPYG